MMARRPSGAQRAALAPKPPESMLLAVRVSPRAGASGVMGMVNGELKVRVAAAPADGQANEELVRLLARFFHVPMSAVVIKSGKASRQKRVQISGVNMDEARKLLSAPV